MAKRVIALLGQPIQNEDAAAAEAITPGMLVALNSSGLVIKHATAGAQAARIFAMERDEMGKTIDDAYAIGDTVKVGAFSQGMRVNALIANGVNVGINALMQSAGNGTLAAVGTIATTPTVPLAAICRTLEAVNNTSGANARIRVEII